jgi:hypothetical protein
MTDLSFLGAGGAPEEPGSNRTKMLLAGVGGVAVLALLAVFVVMPMLSGGGDDSSTVAAPKKKTTTTTTAKKPAAKVPAKAPAPKQLPKTFDEDFQRDPFKPLYVEMRDRPGYNSGGTGGGVTAPTGPTGPTTPYAPNPSVGGSSQQVGGNRVALMDVFVRDGKTYAQTKVGSSVYTPTVGATFARTYRVLSASGTCATYQYGDEQFQLCEGQEVLK